MRGGVTTHRKLSGGSHFHCYLQHIEAKVSISADVFSRSVVNSSNFHARNWQNSHFYMVFSIFERAPVYRVQNKKVTFYQLSRLALSNFCNKTTTLTPEKELDPPKKGHFVVRNTPPPRVTGRGGGVGWLGGWVAGWLGGWVAGGWLVGWLG